MALFQPLVVGSLTLKNRFVMAPLTRCRATRDTHVPTDAMVTYYAQRASAGLIIAEATMVAENQSAFLAEPGIYSQEQVVAWKKVTDAVHAKDGKIILQLWHGGRKCCPLNSNGTQPVAPSAIQCRHQIAAEHNPTGEKIDYSMPRELTDEEVKEHIGYFVRGAKNAIAAGFDGVEIHGANGYLIDEFWRSTTNQRIAPYGGSREGRCKFMLDIVDAVSAAIGADRVGIRLSPVNSYGDMRDEDPVGLVEYTAKQLSARKIAFLHMMRADFFGAQKEEVLSVARANFDGVLFSNMGYEAAEAEAAITAKTLDAVAFGTKFLANPDFPERVRLNKPLNDLRPALFYTHGEEGYTDYPFLA